MIIKLPCTVFVKWGKDNFKFKAYQVRIKWDQNSFHIEGLFNSDVINIGDSNGRNSEKTKRDR